VYHMRLTSGNRKGFMGECNQETVESILDYFYEQGGNFIDTYGVLSFIYVPSIKV
jgi:aryl-alcohol dehydrogenase-like predicted oxidoreductase